MSSEGPVKRGQGRRGRATWNLGFSYAGVVISIGHALLTVPLLLHSVPVAVYGAWLAAGSVLGWIDAVEGNLAGVIQQLVSSAMGGREKTVRSLISNGLALAGCVALMPLALWPAVGVLASVSGGGLGDLATLCTAIRIGLLGVSLGIVATCFLGAIIGLQRIPLAGGIGLIGQIAGTIVTVGLLYLGWGIRSVPIGTVVRFGVILLCCGGWLSERAIRSGSAAGLSLRGIRVIAALALGALGARIGAAVLEKSDSLLVAILISPEAAVTLSVTGKVFEMVRMLLGRIAPAVAPMLSHLHGESGLDASLGIATQIQDAVGTGTSATVVVAIGLSGAVVSAWVNGQGWGGPMLAVLLGGAAGIWVLTATAGQFLFALGRIREVSVASIVEACLRLPVQIAGAGFIGLLAFPAAAATTSVLVMRSLIERCRMGEDDGRAGIASAYVGGLWKLAVATALGGACLFLWQELSIKEGLLVAGLVSGACCGSCALMFVYSDKVVRKLLLARVRALRGLTL